MLLVVSFKTNRNVFSSFTIPIQCRSRKIFLLASLILFFLRYNTLHIHQINFGRFIKCIKIEIWLCHLFSHYKIHLINYSFIKYNQRSICMLLKLLLHPVYELLSIYDGTNITICMYFCVNILQEYSVSDIPIDIPISWYSISMHWSVRVNELARLDKKL